MALGLGFALFALLFTSLFTNLYGLVSATVATDGTLLYWMGQHDYRRGEQPWFYYLLLFPQYEFFAVLFGGAAVVLTGWQTLRIVLRRARPGPRYFFRLFLTIWFLAILAALSWAGEKMPWLVTHIALPGTLLAASLLGELVERWWSVARRTSWVVGEARAERSTLNAAGGNATEPRPQTVDGVSGAAPATLGAPPARAADGAAATYVHRPAPLATASPRRSSPPTAGCARQPAGAGPAGAGRRRRSLAPCSFWPAAGFSWPGG
jgi:predicted membrane-bound mannosyltransferase